MLEDELDSSDFESGDAPPVTLHRTPSFAASLSNTVANITRKRSKVKSDPTHPPAVSEEMFMRMYSSNKDRREEVGNYITTHAQSPVGM
jgi:hypothetical protein